MADRMGRTDLHYAAADADGEKLRDLIAGGADVNATDDEGWTPLHFAAQGQDTAIVEVLLQAEALLDPVDRSGNTPLGNAVFNSLRGSAVARLLLEAGANPDLKNNSGISARYLAENSNAPDDVKRAFAQD